MEHMGPYLQSFLPFAQKRLGFNRPPSIFFDSDAENAQQVLGKTGYYDPDALEIVIFVDNRHPKDVLRSLSHELVHHAQNCRGDLNPEVAGETELGYAQNNAHMRGMESEAYEKGNLCMRDWEDSVKLQLQETNYLHTKGDNHKMAAYDELKERITKSVVQKMLERKKRKNNRNDRGIPQRLKEDEEGEEPLEELFSPKDWAETYAMANQRRDTSKAPEKDPEEEEEIEELEERRRRDFPPANVGAMPATLKVNEEDDEALDTLEEDEDETLDEWYQKELYQKLTNRWTQ